MRRVLRRRTVPVHVRASLERDAAAAARRALVCVAALLRARGLLADDGIRALAFKGPAIAAQAYGDYALRLYDDVDLLVDPLDAARAVDLLIQNGYAAALGTRGETLARMLENESACELGGPDGVLVDLHWGMMDPSFGMALDFDGLLGRAALVDLAGHRVETLAPEDALLAACLHASKHLWQRLSWIADVAALLGLRPALDWDRVWQSAASLGATRMVAVGTLLAEQLLGARVPPHEEWRQAAFDRSTLALATRACGLAFGEVPPAPSAMARLAFHLRVRDGLAHRATYAYRAATMPTAADLSQNPLPRGAEVLYPVVRAARLTGLLGRRR